MSGFPPKVIRALKNRSRGLCEGCGLAPATEAHHRQYRSRGGTETLDNALHLCGWGNHTGCHGIAHSGRQGEACGWAVRTGFSTLEVPVLMVPSFHEQWFTLPTEGPPAPVMTLDAVEFMTLIGAIRQVA
jgi:hypothetical protein